MLVSIEKLIDQLIGVTPNKTNDKKRDERVCKCSLGKLLIAQSDRSFISTKQCNKNFVCFFVATEKYKVANSSKNIQTEKKGFHLPSRTKKIVFNKEPNQTNDLLSKFI
ncbi:MAG: hypothetical protein ACXAC7_20880 [Candidatus Hodarchaeales archaeon]